MSYYVNDKILLYKALNRKRNPPDQTFLTKTRPRPGKTPIENITMERGRANKREENDFVTNNDHSTGWDSIGSHDTEQHVGKSIMTLEYANL